MINNLSQSIGRISGRNHSRLFQLLLTITGGGVSLLLLFLLLMGAQSEAQAAFSNQVAGVDIGLDQNGSGLPSEIVTYYHTLTNTGDSPDTYSITLESSVPAGWNVTIEPTTTASIPAGATMPFTVMVQIASNAISGTEYAAVIQATSMTDTAVIDTLTDTTTVNLAFDLALIPSSITGTTTAGTNVTYTHFIVNNSNAAETIQIETRSTPAWTITPAMQMVSVGPFEMEPFSFTIGIPPDGAGTVHTALVTATSSLSPSVQLTATDITTVNEIPGASGVWLAPDNMGIGAPNQPIYYNHFITNTSGVAQTFEIVAESSNGWFTLPSVGFPDTVSLAPGETKPVEIFMSIANVVSGTMDTMTVTATSVVSPAVTDSAFNVTTVISGQIPGVDISPNYTSTAVPGETVEYIHRLTNLGNDLDTFTITVSSDLGWSVSAVPSSISLFAGQQFPVTVTVNVPPGALSGTINTTTITATSELSPAVSDIALDVTMVISQQVAGVDIFPDNAQTASPGNQVFYTHTVENTGTNFDTFTIAPSSDQGWTVSVTPTVVGLGSGQQAMVSVTVNVPPGAVSGTVDTTSVTATSDFDPAVSDTALDVTTVISEPIAGVEIAPDNNSIAVPGAQILYAHFLTNTGNSFDTFTLTVSSDQGWPVSVMPTSIGLSAGQVFPISVTVDVPPGAISGTVDTTTVTATSGVDPAVFDTALDTTTVVSDTAGVILSPDNVGSGAPGEILEYGHTISNLGGQIETFNMTVNSSEGWEVYVNPSVIQILGNDSRTVSVTVFIPGTATSGTVDVTTVTATAQSDPAITDSATDTTTVIGSGFSGAFLPVVLKDGGGTPPTPTPTPTTAPCILNPPPGGNPLGVDLVVTDITLVPANPQPGQNTIVQVTIKNQGQTDVTYGNNFYLDFYDNPNPEPPQNFQIGNVAWGVQGADLEAGASKTFSANYVFGIGNHRLWAQVDTDRTVNEANENNNLYGCKAVTVSGAQSAPQETPQPQPTADQPRATPTPNDIKPPEAAEPPKPAETPAP